MIDSDCDMLVRAHQQSRLPRISMATNGQVELSLVEFWSWGSLKQKQGQQKTASQSCTPTTVTHEEMMSERGVSARQNKTSWLYFGKVVALKIEINGHTNKLDLINVIIASWSTQLNLKNIRFDQLTYCECVLPNWKKKKLHSTNIYFEYAVLKSMKLRYLWIGQYGWVNIQEFWKLKSFLFHSSIIFQSL